MSASSSNATPDASLDALNALSRAEMEERFRQCSGVKRWSSLMAERAPFANRPHLMEAAEDTWSKLTREEWLEAFAAHPRIGDIEVLRAKYRMQGYMGHSQSEQSNAQIASEEVLQELKDLNDKYFDKYGHIFIVFATGKSAPEMLAILKDRIKNTAEQEFSNASTEQKKITQLRMSKL